MPHSISRGFFAVVKKYRARFHISELTFVRLYCFLSPPLAQKNLKSLETLSWQPRCVFYRGTWNCKCTEHLVTVIHTGCAHLMTCQLEPVGSITAQTAGTGES